MRKKQPPVWLTGSLPVLEETQSVIKRRIRVRNWLRKKRASSYGYRLHEAKMQRERRARQA